MSEAVRVLIIGLLLYCVGFVWGVLSCHKEHEEAIAQGWSPPEIPQCDEELWERIKDRCGNTD